MQCAKCAGLVIPHHFTSYEPVEWKCLNCGYMGRVFDQLPVHLCGMPGCNALTEAPWSKVCQRHRYEQTVGLEDVMGKWSDEAKARLRAKRGKPPLRLVANGQHWKETALKALQEELSAIDARKVAIGQAIASIEAAP